MDIYTLTLLACIGSLDDAQFSKREKATNFLTAVNQVYDIEDFVISNSPPSQEAKVRVKRIIQQSPREANIDFFPYDHIDMECFQHEFMQAIGNTEPENTTLEQFIKTIDDKNLAAKRALDSLYLYNSVYYSFNPVDIEEVRAMMISNHINSRKDKVKVGDYVLCSCPTGCYDDGNCVISCNQSNSCSNLPSWKKVVSILRQPGAHTYYFQLNLENNKVKYGWFSTLVTIK